MVGESTVVEVLDPKQLARIEAVHRGFLYQHLYAVACLLLAGESGVTRVTVERDEDVELELSDGTHYYLQLKDRTAALTFGIVEGALQRFDAIREEHRLGKRKGAALFAIVSSSAPGPDLESRISNGTLASDITFVWPDALGTRPPSMPPAWTDISGAAAWCVERAERLPMLTVSPQTLVWKLAGLLQAASAGDVAAHAFEVSMLPTLFEQLVLQLQQFPEPPTVYRPIADEPELISDVRVRIVTGFSGAGKTAWAAQAATHSPNETAYYDVGDVPARSIAAQLTRELAAHWAASSAEGLRRVLLPAPSGLDGLRALDAFLEDTGAQALVVLDNAHRVPVADLRMLIDATRHLRIVLLAHPTASIGELEAQTGLKQELLQGWGLDQAAAEVHEQGARASAKNLARLWRVTGGLPLYVRTAVQLSISQYGGDVSALCDALEASTNLVATQQEIILTGIFDAQEEAARDCVAVLSISDVPLSQPEALGLIRGTMAITPGKFAAIVRQLAPLGIVRIFNGQRLQIHDALRVLGRRRFDEMPEGQIEAAMCALRDLLEASLEAERNTARFPLFVRTLVELRDLDALTDLATEEWFHELNAGEDVWHELQRAADNVEVAPQIRFDALDALAYASARSNDDDGTRRHLADMKRLLSEHDLGRRSRLVYLNKQAAQAAEDGDHEGTRQAIDQLRQLTPARPNYQRILEYSIALLLFKLDRHQEMVEIIEPLVQQYCELLQFGPLPLLSTDAPRFEARVTATETSAYDIRHLADSLDLLARGWEKTGRDPGRARAFAIFFYKQVNALSSYVKVGQDLVDEHIGRRDHASARALIERELLPTVIQHDMHDYLVSVRSQYAVVLAFCLDFDGAFAEFEQLEHYAPGLSERQLMEISQQRRQVVRMQRQAAEHGLG